MISTSLSLGTPPDARPRVLAPAAILGAANIAFDYNSHTLSGLFQDSALTTPVTAYTQPIGGALDAGTLGATMLRATAGLRPTYQLGAGNRPVIRFDGVDDYLQSAFFDLAGLPLTIWAWMSVTPGAAGVHDTLWDGQNVDKCQFLVQDAPQTVMWAGAGVTYNKAVCNGVFEAVCAVYDGAASKLYQDNVLRASGNTGANTPTWGTIGARPDGTQSCAFDLVRLIGARLSPTGPQRDLMQLYLATQ